MSSYKILLYVVNSRGDILNGQILEYPIIPRVGDFINVKIQKDNVIYGGNFEVKSVFINQTGNNVDAQINVVTDEDTN